MRLTPVTSRPHDAAPRAVAAALAALTLAVGLSSRPVFGQAIAPPAFAASEGPRQQFALLQTDASTYQVQYASAQLGGLSIGQRISGLSFRLDSLMQPQTLTYSSYSVILSQAAHTVPGMVLNYAANELNPVTVYNAALTFPAGSQPSGGSPNAFGPSIAFSTLYTYLGGDLVLTFSHSASSTGGFPGVGLDADDESPIVSGYTAQFATTQNAVSATNPGATVVVTRFDTAVSSTGAPEPGTLALLSLGFLALAGIIARRRRGCVRSA